jgi:hypothetical protein
MSDSVLCKTGDRNHQKNALKTQNYFDPRSNTRGTPREAKRQEIQVATALTRLGSAIIGKSRC